MDGLPLLLILAHQGVVGLLRFMDAELLAGEPACDAIVGESGARKRGACGREKRFLSLVVGGEVSTGLGPLRRKDFG